MPRQIPVSAFEAADFSGGLNLRDAPTKVGDNETPLAINVTLDERGGLMMRLGLERLNASPFAGVATSLFYSATLDLFFFQVGATLYKTTSAWSVFTAVTTFTSSGRADWCDFNGKAVFCQESDGVFTYDGATWTLATAAVKGRCIAAWQNKVWVGGDVRAGNASIVWWSNAGNAAVWTTATDFNGIRDKDDQLITCLGVGQGDDDIGRPGLLVFKEESLYRINSASTGSYTTIDTRVGACGPMAVTALFGYAVWFCKSGIYRYSEGGGVELMSSKVGPIFTPRQINMAALASVAAGVYRDRVLFSFPWGETQTTNNRTLEFHPLEGWIMPHDFGAAAYATYSKASAKLYSASPSAAYVRETFKGGADEGVAITARYQTRWYVIERGYLVQLLRLRAAGSGIFDLYTKFDFSLGQGDLYPAALIGDAFVWNDPAAVWNTAAMVWGPSVYEQYEDFFDLGAGQSVSFVFEKTASTPGAGPQLLGDGFAPEIGAFSVYSLLLDYVRLGLA